MMSIRKKWILIIIVIIAIAVLVTPSKDDTTRDVTVLANDSLYIDLGDVTVLANARPQLEEKLIWSVSQGKNAHDFEEGGTHYVELQEVLACARDSVFLPLEEFLDKYPPTGIECVPVVNK